MSKLRLATLAAVALPVVFALAACDGDGASTPTATPTGTAPQQTGTATPTPASLTPTDSAAVSPGASTPPPEGTRTPAATESPATRVTILTPVDKDHALPPGYVPPGLETIPNALLAPGFGGRLRDEALDALILMLDDAAAAGHDVRVRSAYRSYAEQESTFDYWVSVLGYDEAVRVSAMPGHSEHQLGTTVDLTSPEVGWDLLESFGETVPGQWLAEHAHEYGFALSYPLGAEDVTGYSYEPWHFRWIGVGPAEDWKASGLTLNQYLLP